LMPSGLALLQFNSSLYLFFSCSWCMWDKFMFSQVIPHQNILKQIHIDIISVWTTLYIWSDFLKLIKNLKPKELSILVNHTSVFHSSCYSPITKPPLPRGYYWSGKCYPPLYFCFLNR
jgi:hypothetical protein